MEVTRIFHPVGQGGFYTELFEHKKLVVYDCGGNSGPQMKQYIDSFLPKDSEIEVVAIFISHLHNDHINGLQRLLDKSKNCKLFLPHITPNRIIEAILYNAIYCTDAEFALFQNLFRKIIKKTEKNVKVIQVNEDTGEESQESYNLDEVNRYVIASGTRIYIEESGRQINGSSSKHPTLKWVYIPYNQKNPKLASSYSGKDAQIKKIHQLLENASKMSEDDAIENILEELDDLLKNKSVDDIKNIYTQLFGSIHNSQSMTVFSGLVNQPHEIEIEDNIFVRQRDIHHLGCDLCWHPRHCMHFGKIPCNFIYTGDYEECSNSTSTMLVQYYKQHWDTLCGIQIPHHGSKNNYYQELYENKCFAIASAGVNNSFNHPDIVTLVNIIEQGCMTIVVTEEVNTLKYQHFKIH